MVSTKLKIMNALKNKVQLIGNLGNAPEVRNTESGKKLVRFSIATNESLSQCERRKGNRNSVAQFDRLG